MMRGPEFATNYIRQFKARRVLNNIDQEAEVSNSSKHLGLDAGFSDPIRPFLPSRTVLAEFSVEQLRKLSEAGKGIKGKSREIVVSAQEHPSYYESNGRYGPDQYSTEAMVFADGMVRLAILARSRRNRRFDSISTYKKEEMLGTTRELVTAWSARTPTIVYAASIENNMPVFLLQIQQDAHGIQSVKKIYFDEFGEATQPSSSSIEEAGTFLSQLPASY